MDAVRALLPSIQAELPASLTLDIRNDRSAPIRESVHDVKLTLALTNQTLCDNSQPRVLPSRPR